MRVVTRSRRQTYGHLTVYRNLGSIASWRSHARSQDWAPTRRSTQRPVLGSGYWRDCGRNSQCFHISNIHLVRTGTDLIYYAAEDGKANQGYSVYTIPGELFQVPTAYVWIFTARLVTGQGLPYMAKECAIAAGTIFVFTTLARTAFVNKPWRPWIPGGIAVAVGKYYPLTPVFCMRR